MNVDDGMKRAALNAILARLDLGSSVPAASFILKNSAGGTLATLSFSPTSFAPAVIAGSLATATSNAIADSPTPTSGTVGFGAFRDRDNVERLPFSIGTSGADMLVANVTIPSGATAVTCSGVTISLNLT